MEELVSMNRKTRKILAMNGCLHTRMSLDCICRERKGRGFIGVEECVMEECKSLHGCMRKSTEWMLPMALKEKVLVEDENIQNYEKLRLTIAR